MPTGRGRPRKPRLRRASSRAYYATFAALTVAVARHYPAGAARLAVRRLVSDAAARRACEDLQRTRTVPWLHENPPCHPELLRSRPTSSPCTSCDTWPTTTTTTRAPSSMHPVHWDAPIERSTHLPRRANSAQSNSTYSASPHSRMTGAIGRSPSGRPPNPREGRTTPNISAFATTLRIPASGQGADHTHHRPTAPAFASFPHRLRPGSHPPRACDGRAARRSACCRRSQPCER